MSKKDALIKVGGLHPIQWGPEKNKSGERANLKSQLQLRYLDSDQDLMIFLVPTSVTPIFRPLDSEWIIPQTFLVLKLAEGILWDFVASTTTGANICFICVSPIGSVSRVNSNNLQGRIPDSYKLSPRTFQRVILKYLLRIHKQDQSASSHLPSWHINISPLFVPVWYLRSADSIPSKKMSGPHLFLPSRKYCLGSALLNMGCHCH